MKSEQIFFLQLNKIKKVCEFKRKNGVVNSLNGIYKYLYEPYLINSK